MKAFFAGALALALPCAAIAQIAVLQIKVLTGEAGVHQPGARVPHPITVEVTDENGRAVAGAAVSFQLPPEGPSGLFPNGLRTDLVLTDASGRAAIHSVQLNKTGGQFRIRITAVKEQARAGAVSLQYIGPSAAANHSPEAPVQATPKSGEVTSTAAATRTAQTAKSGEVTKTTAKMGSGSHKKLILLAGIVAAGAGAAFLGMSRAAASKSTVSSSVVSIGTPTITIGHP